MAFMLHIFNSISYIDLISAMGYKCVLETGKVTGPEIPEIALEQRFDL